MNVTEYRSELERGDDLDQTIARLYSDEQLREVWETRRGSIPPPPEPARKNGHKPNRGLRVIEASGIEMRAVDWLERDLIPAAALTLLAGMGGKGKSTLAASYAARATRGELHGKYLRQPINVLWVGNEDGREEVVAPRLRMAGADLERVGFVTIDSTSLGDEVNLVTDIDALRDTIRAYEAKLVILDPVVEYLPGGTDSHNDMSVRQALRPLRNLATELQVTPLGLVHLNKGDSLDVATRIAGSAAFRNTARSVLVVADYPEEEGWRVCYQTKSNLGPETGQGRLYRVEGVDVTTEQGVPVLDAEGKPARTGVIRLGKWVEIDPGLLPARDTTREAPKLESAKALLFSLLKGGPRKKEEIAELAEAVGIKSFRTVESAKAERRSFLVLSTVRMRISRGLGNRGRGRGREPLASNGFEQNSQSDWTW